MTEIHGLESTLVPTSDIYNSYGRNMSGSEEYPHGIGTTYISIEVHDKKDVSMDNLQSTRLSNRLAKAHYVVDRMINTEGIQVLVNTPESLHAIDECALMKGVYF